MRKMGHVNVLADSLEELLKKASLVQKLTAFETF